MQDPSTFDLYCIGVQESRYPVAEGDNTPYRHDRTGTQWVSDTEEWFGMLGEALGDGFYRVGEQTMWEIKIVVFAKVDHEPFISNVQTFYQPTGIGGVWYNKVPLHTTTI